MNKQSISVLILATTLGACSSSMDSMDSMKSMDSMMPSLELNDQAMEGGMVTITSLTLDKPGYVVVHKDNEGKPGPVIGHSDLLEAGSYTGYPVAIDAEQAGMAVFPMLHYDNGDGAYEFPGADGPVKAGDKVLVGKVTWQ